MKVAGMDLMQLAHQQVAIYQANRMGYCELLVNSECPRDILRMAYESLTRQRKITAIEDMLIEEKTIAWEMAKDLANDRLKKPELIHLVKALIAIEYFLSLKKN